MRDVAQIVAEAATDRKCQKLCPIETEASTPRTAFGSINDDGVRSSPSERGFCTSDISQLDRHRWHDHPPSSLGFYGNIGPIQSSRALMPVGVSRGSAA